jgi:hypothetical protein
MNILWGIQCLYWHVMLGTYKVSSYAMLLMSKIQTLKLKIKPVILV